MTCKKRLLEEIISKFGEIPLCKCKECQDNGTKINVIPDKNGSYSRYRNGYPEYLPGHSNKGENNAMLGKKRPEHSEAMKGSGNPMFGNPREDLQIKFKGEGNPMFGETPWNKDKPWSPEIIEKIKISTGFGEYHHRYGKKDSEETRLLKSINNSMHNPEVKKKHHEIVNSSEFRENMSKTISELWRDEEFRKKQAESYTGYGIQSYYNSPLQGRIRLRSSYELKYAQYLDSQKILWFYEIETFELSNNILYIPDFFLPQFEKFVEIKGWLKPLDKIKIDKFREEYPWDLEVLFKKDLQNLGINLRGN